MPETAEDLIASHRLSPKNASLSWKDLLVSVRGRPSSQTSRALSDSEHCTLEVSVGSTSPYVRFL